MLRSLDLPKEIMDVALNCYKGNRFYARSETLFDAFFQVFMSAKGTASNMKEVVDRALDKYRTSTPDPH